MREFMPERTEVVTDEVERLLSDDRYLEITSMIDHYRTFLDHDTGETIVTKAPNLLPSAR